MFRSFAVLIIAPFPVALVQAMVVSLWPKIGRGGVFEHPSSMFVAMNLYFYIFGLLFGFPAWLVLRRRSASLIALALLGAFVGLAPIGLALVVTALRGQASLYVVIYNLMLFGLGGVVAGAVFWRFAVRHKLELETSRKATST